MTHVAHVCILHFNLERAQDKRVRAQTHACAHDCPSSSPQTHWVMMHDVWVMMHAGAREEQEGREGGGEDGEQQAENRGEHARRAEPLVHLSPSTASEHVYLGGV